MQATVAVSDEELTWLSDHLQKIALMHVSSFKFATVGDRILGRVYLALSIVAPAITASDIAGLRDALGFLEEN